MSYPNWPGGFHRFLLKALDLFWHEDCLMCGCCGCRLGEVGSTLYTKANMILCKKDYFRYLMRQTRRAPYTMLLLIDRFYRMFGNKGMCAACFKDIPAFEMVMRARSNVYHLECFACQQCNHRYVGRLRLCCARRVHGRKTTAFRSVAIGYADNPSELIRRWTFRSVLEYERIRTNGCRSTCIALNCAILVLIRCTKTFGARNDIRGLFKNFPNLRS